MRHGPGQPVVRGQGGPGQHHVVAGHQLAAVVAQPDPGGLIAAGLAADRYPAQAGQQDVTVAYRDVELEGDTRTDRAEAAAQAR